MSGRIFLFLVLLYLPLTAEQITVHTIKQSEQTAQPITTEFRAQPNRALVGQELACECVVTYDPRRITVRGLQIPEYGDRVFYEPFQGPAREQVDQNVRLTWSTKLYPRQAGVMRLPGVQVEYGRIQERQENFGSIFSWAFSREEQLHQLKSDDLVFTVDPLPKTSGPIDAVGRYLSCAVQVDRSSVVQGEAVALTVDLKGSGNAGFEQTFSPTVPQGVVWYRDGVKRVPGGAQFKFVAQCNGAGTVTIPVQRCVCYDPFKKEFYTLMSQPVTISVAPGATQAPVQITNTSEPGENDRDDEMGAADDRDVFLEPSLVRKAAIPQNLFWLLCIVQLVGLMCWRWKKFLSKFYSRVMFLLCRAGGRLRLSILSWRGKLSASDAYNFFLRYAACERDDRDWQDFWLGLQQYYFGGHADKILSRGESARVLYWANRAESRFVILILMSFLSAPLHADSLQKTDSLGTQIRDLRICQHCASLSVYDDIDRRIAELRGPQSTCSRYTTSIARACRVGHLLPFIVWQLLFLLGLLLVFVRRLRLVGILIIVSVGLVLLFAAYERSDRWRYVLVDTALYLGPGSGYPIRKGLVHGDEVRVIRRAPEKTNEWMFIDACGEKGWLPHDAVV